jgi:hypothetical protein
MIYSHSVSRQEGIGTNTLLPADGQNSSKILPMNTEQFMTFKSRRFFPLF